MMALLSSFNGSIYPLQVVMKECLQFICWLCFTPEGSSLIFQRAAIFSLNILKQVMLCPEYKPSKHDNLSGVGEFADKKTLFLLTQLHPSSCEINFWFQEAQPRMRRGKRGHFSTTPRCGRFVARCCKTTFPSCTKIWSSGTLTPSSMVCSS